MVQRGATGSGQAPGGLDREQKERDTREEGKEAEEGRGPSPLKYGSSFRNVPLNQLNGPLVEQGPPKVEEMGEEAGAASSGAWLGGRLSGAAAGQGESPRRSLQAGLVAGTFAFVPPDLLPSPRT